MEEIKNYVFGRRSIKYDNNRQTLFKDNLDNMTKDIEKNFNINGFYDHLSGYTVNASDKNVHDFVTMTVMTKMSK